MHTTVVREDSIAEKFGLAIGESKDVIEKVKEMRNK